MKLFKKMNYVRILLLTFFNFYAFAIVINNISDSKFTFLISGGTRVDKIVNHLSTYIVSIRSREPQRYFGDNHFCAGVIVAPTAVLTAAHCLMDKRKVLTRKRRLLLVAATKNRLEALEDITVYLPVSTVTIHPRYIRYSENDIAIVKTKISMPTTTNKLVKIFDRINVPVPREKPCMILGWGRMYLGGPLEAIPQTAKVKIWSDEKCKKTVPIYHKGLLCGEGVNGATRAPCRGDSGGPLICNNQLAGIISWAIGCESDKVPSIYTDLYVNVDFINSSINGAIQHKLVLSLNFLLLLIYLFVFV